MSFLALLFATVITAYFDANNVQVGDPMILTVDCVGTEFTEVHPPAISKEVNPKVWKVDDESAKTETFTDGRRFVYRVRPLQEGIQYFPAITFLDAKTTPIPVHVKPGTQAALSGLDQDLTEFPQPDGILAALAETVSDDTLFRWQKACRKPSAEAFAAFHFSEARLNEAACHILDGNWAKAIKIYSLLEWRTGQTPAIERGIVAALARKHNSAAVELPVWRATFRPILQYAWQGRLLILAGIVLAGALFLWLCGRLIRLFICVGVVLLVPQLHADELQATLLLSPPQVQVGEPFDFIVSIERPKGVTLGHLQYQPTTAVGLTILGAVQNLPDQPSTNAETVISRQVIPARYDVPFQGDFSFLVSGMATVRREEKRPGFSFVSQSSHSFQIATPPLALHVQPLPGENQPADFSGAVGTGFVFAQVANPIRVETNDVVKVTYIFNDDFTGYLPPQARLQPRYFIADGALATPSVDFVYYDTTTKTYERLTAEGTPLTYYVDDKEEPSSVALDNAQVKNVLRLRFYPSAQATILATIPQENYTRGEEVGAWVRIETPTHAGWVKQEELK